MAKKLHVTLAQINPVMGDLDYNAAKILDIWKHAPGDLVVFPELAVCGYPPEDLVLNTHFQKQVKKTVSKIVKESAAFKAAALIPCPIVSGKKIYNAVHVVENGKIIATRRKHELPNYGVFDEKRIFTPGALPKPVEFRGVQLGVMICEDMWFPKVAGHLKKNGAEILIIPNASPYDSENVHHRLERAQARVTETGLPLIYVNQIGGQDELVFDGGSFVLNSGGHIIMRGDEFIEGAYHVVLEKRESGPWLAEVDYSAEKLSQEAEIYQALVLGLRDYVTKNGFPGVLLGLSGGIDSALVAAIATDALGPKAVRCFLLPSRFTSQDSTEDAQIVAENLGLTLGRISIEDPVKAFNDVLAPHFTKDTPSTTFENIQPRARGVILMALSNASNFMLLTTGNKSEVAAGYATLYGDMCGGFNVLKDVYKTQVYALSKWRNKNKPLNALGPSGTIIPERVLTKAPTAELKHNQKDQDTLPPYDMLDAILHGLIEENLDVKTIVSGGVADRKTVLRVSKMLDMAEYKRRQAAPGIKITAKAFGRDRRYPITNRFTKYH